MPKDHIPIYDKDGEIVFVAYDELDPDIYPQLLKPIGGFIYEATSFLRLPLPEIPFYIKDWLPKHGKAEFYGGAKAGKSYLATQLARCIASGSNFLGIPTSSATVLYLQFELGLQLLQTRLDCTGQDYDNIFLGTTFSMKLDKKDGQEQLLEAMYAVKPQVLILDPWYKLFGVGDENEAKDVEVLVNFLDEFIIDNFDCSVLIIHHAGKDLAKGGRGSSVLEGWVDSCIAVKKVSKKGERLRIEIEPKLLRHAELPPKSLSLTLGDDFEFQLDEQIERNATVLERVEQKLAKTGKLRGKTLIDEGLGSRKSVYDALKMLERKGKVEKQGKEYVWLGGDNCEIKRKSTIGGA